MSVGKRELLKRSAIQLRREGYSYSLISERIGVTKSTLSDWLKLIPYSPNVETQKRARFGPLEAARLRHQRKLQRVRTTKNMAHAELGLLSKRDLWLFGIGLYLGEGSKTIECVRFTNSDPKVIKASVVWLKEICGLTERNFKLHIHTYPDNDFEKNIEYWSRVTGIPKTQVGKIQIDKRNKRRNIKGKLPHGTVQVRVFAGGESKFGVELHRRIMGWIEAVSEQIYKRD